MTTAQITDSPLIVDVPADYYHADHSAISKTMLWTFMQRKRLYEAEYVLHSPMPARKPTAEMDIGEIAHAALLEPDKLRDRYVVIPDAILASNGAASTKEAKAFKADAEASGRVVLKADQLDTIRSMVLSVGKTFRQWLDCPAKRESAIYWTEPTTGRRCKCRPDWLIVSRDTAFIFDVKTTADASPAAFRNRCEAHGYWLQDAHYSEGVNIATGLDTEFHFVVIETKFPFACNVQRIDHRSAVQAEKVRLEAMRDLASRLDSGDFSEPWENDIQPLVMRPWCFDPSVPFGGRE